jgi:hypothetical protein
LSLLVSAADLIRGAIAVGLAVGKLAALTAVGARLGDVKREHSSVGEIRSADDESSIAGGNSVPENRPACTIRSITPSRSPCVVLAEFKTERLLEVIAVKVGRNPPDISNNNEIVGCGDL